MSKYILLFFFVLISNFSVAQTNNLSGSQISHSSKLLNLGINEFTVIGNTELEEQRGKKIKDILVLFLLEYADLIVEEIEFGNKSDFREFHKRNNLDYYLNSRLTIGDKQVLLDINIIQVQSALFDSSNTFKRENLIYENESLTELIKSMSIYSEEVYKTIRDIEKNDNEFLTIASSCFINDQESNYITSFVSENLNSLLFEKLESARVQKIENIQLKNFFTSIEECKASDLQDLIGREDIDIIVQGSFEVDSTDFSVNTWIKLVESGVEIGLDSYAGASSEYDIISEIVTKKASDFVYALFDSTNKIKYELFMDTSMSALLSNAEQTYRDKNYVLSEYFYRKVIEEQPINDHRLKLAEIYSETEQFNLSNNILADVLEEDSGNLNALSIRGENYFNSSDYNLALVSLKKILEIDSEYPGIHLKLGRNYYFSSEVDSAEIELKKSIELEEDEHVSVAHNYLGRIYFDKDSLDRAIYHLTESLKFNPDYFSSKFILSIIYTNRGIDQFIDERYAEALNNFIKAREKFESSEIFDLLRLTYVMLDEIEESILFLDEGIKKKYFEREQIYFEHALLLISITNNNPRKIEMHCPPSINLLKLHLRNEELSKSEKSESNFLIGNCNAKLGNTKESRRFLEIAHDNDPISHSIILDLAEVLIIENNADSASNILDRMTFSNESIQDSTEMNQVLIQHYLYVVIDLIQNNKDQEAISIKTNLYGRINEERVKIKHWNFDTFINWISLSDIENKTEILELTNDLRIPSVE